MLPQVAAVGIVVVAAAGIVVVGEHIVAVDMVGVAAAAAAAGMAPEAVLGVLALDVGLGALPVTA